MERSRVSVEDHARYRPSRDPPFPGPGRPYRLLRAPPPGADRHPDPPRSGALAAPRAGSRDLLGRGSVGSLRRVSQTRPAHLGRERATGATTCPTGPLQVLRLTASDSRPTARADNPAPPGIGRPRKAHGNGLE
jgi:hypothetical protein